MKVKRGYKGMEVGEPVTCVLRASGKIGQGTFRAIEVERAWHGKITPRERALHRELGITPPRRRVVRLERDVSHTGIRHQTKTPRAGFGGLVLFDGTSSKGRMVNR